MIEAELLLGAALYATTAISLPYLALNRSRNCYTTLRLLLGCWHARDINSDRRLKFRRICLDFWKWHCITECFDERHGVV